MSETESSQGQCGCNAAPKLIFPCSGAADLGLISDQAARKMAKDGVGKMFCLAGIGGRVPGMMHSTQAAAKVLVIDGCALECARKTLELAGFSGFAHLQVQRDLGLVKGESPATDDRVRQVAERATVMLQ